MRTGAGKLLAGSSRGYRTPPGVVFDCPSSWEASHCEWVVLALTAPPLPLAWLPEPGSTVGGRNPSVESWRSSCTACRALEGRLLGDSSARVQAPPASCPRAVSGDHPGLVV